MNPQFYVNQNNTMSAAAAAASMTASSNHMLAHRLNNAHHHNHRNSVGSSSSAESSSTSILDENSPVGAGFHHPTLPRYTNANTASQYPYMDSTTAATATSSSSQAQEGANTPLINAATILNRMNRHESSQSASGSLPLKKRRPVPVEHKDSSYWEKRRKNNESAKKSRDSKREKENHMAMRISYLERENFELKTRCACLMQENEKLTNMLIAAQNSSTQVPSTN